MLIIKKSEKIIIYKVRQQEIANSILQGWTDVSKGKKAILKLENRIMKLSK